VLAYVFVYGLRTVLGEAHVLTGVPAYCGPYRTVQRAVLVRVTAGATSRTPLAHQVTRLVCDWWACWVADFYLFDGRERI